MSTPCGACGADPGVEFAFCPICGTAHAGGVAAGPTGIEIVPSPVIAFDRAPTFYQPVEPAIPARPAPIPALSPWRDLPGADAVPTMMVVPRRERPGASPDLPLAYLVVRGGVQA